MKSIPVFECLLSMQHLLPEVGFGLFIRILLQPGIVCLLIPHTKDHYYGVASVLEHKYTSYLMQGRDLLDKTVQKKSLSTR